MAESAEQSARFLPTPDAAALARRWPLDPGRFHRGGPRGEYLAAGTGSSVEFHDRRAYAPGDDPRRIDWRAWARTDEYTVLVQRAEVRPRVEIVLDASRSMAVEEAKARTALDLAVFLEAAAQAGGSRAVLLAAADEPQPLDLDHLRERGQAFDGARPLAEELAALGARLRPGGLRLFVSDFLFPHEPGALVRGLAAGASRTLLLQVLGASDLEPPPVGAWRFEDSETGAVLEHVVDEPAREAYRTRLTRLQDGLAEEARRAGASFVSCAAGEGLERIVRTKLAPLGLFGV